MRYKLCECGCGEPAPIATKTIPQFGHVKGHAVRFINGHSNRGKKLRKRTEEERLKMSQSKMGEKNPNWKGDHSRWGSARARARRKYKTKPCEVCGDIKKSEIHHKDGNVYNNEKENIQFLCRRCHMNEDGRMKKFIENKYINGLKGERNPRSKLNTKDVIEIRWFKKFGIENIELAKIYNVSKATISLIINKKLWKHI